MKKYTAAYPLPILNRFAQAIIILAGMLALSALIPAEAQNPADAGLGRSVRESGPAAGSLSVSGDGEAFLAPDRARITFVLQENSGALAAAGEALKKKEKRLVDAVGAAVPGIKVLHRGDRIHGPSPETPVSLNSVSIAERNITFEAVRPDLAGTVIEAGLKNGAKSLDEIQFLAAEDSAPYEQAIELASGRAKAKAAAAAKGLGVKLGAPIEVVVTEEPAGEAIQRDRELGRDPNRFSSRSIRIFVSVRYAVITE